MVFKVVAISGSLQKASTNTALLRACIEANNPDLQIQILDISEFPHLNPDLIQNGKFPAPVEKARRKVVEADAILFAIPQYNYRMSAPMKNAYDWLSIAPNPEAEQAPVKQKIAAMLSSGLNGGNQAQEHFIQATKYCKVKLMKDPSIQVKRYEQGNFDEQGNLVNKKHKEQVGEFLKSFVQFIKKQMK